MTTESITAYASIGAHAGKPRGAHEPNAIAEVQREAKGPRERPLPLGGRRSAAGTILPDAAGAEVFLVHARPGAQTRSSPAENQSASAPLPVRHARLLKEILERAARPARMGFSRSPPERKRI